MKTETRSSSASGAAQAASRRNGARSRGPTSQAGKAISAKNAVRHGLRAGCPIRPEQLPDWIRRFEVDLTAQLGVIGHDQREQIDKLLSAMVLIEMADRHIAAEMTRLGEALARGTTSEVPVSSHELNVSMLRKFCAYRWRFRARRDKCLKRIMASRSKLAVELAKKAAEPSPADG